MPVSKFPEYLSTTHKCGYSIMIQKSKNVSSVDAVFMCPGLGKSFNAMVMLNYFTNLLPLLAYSWIGCKIFKDITRFCF